ncbi:MAG: hypothetical protein KC468_36670 [Myxococcales bacterium]|nr:hypothetical protein [Myxococcales bacterium]
MSPRPKADVDELELARRVALGDSQRVLADVFEVPQSLVSRRITGWRQELAVAAASKPAAVSYWLREANSVRVARRYLYLKTQESRWAPLENEDF